MIIKGDSYGCLLKGMLFEAGARWWPVLVWWPMLFDGDDL